MGCLYTATSTNLFPHPSCSKDTPGTLAWKGGIFVAPRMHYRLRNPIFNSGPVLFLINVNEVREGM
jgi:hypothetical protein